MDMSDAESMRAAVQHVVDEKGRIDVLVNNAGVGCVAALETIPVATAKEVFEINFFGVIALCQHVIPHMRSRNTGHIINVSSIGGMIGLPFQGIYSASKFSIEGISESLSMETRQFGIKVVVVEPGDYRTNIYKNRRIHTEDSSPYGNSVNEISDIMTTAVKEGRDPSEIGVLVLKILRKKNPRLRYATGEFSQKLACAAKRVFPARLFERIIMQHYQVPT